MIRLNEITIGHRHPLFEVEKLDLQRGQLIVLIGPNGAGKTTFFNALLGIHPTLKGEIMIHGKALSTLNRRSKNQLFGFVPSRFSGVQHLTLRELIALGRAPYTNMLNRLSEKDHAIIDEVLNTLSIDHLGDKNTLEVSDGERQIAMIGKVLAQSTKAILLDEPTAFLDYSNRKKILALLKKLAHQENKLVIISSHDIDLCMEHADEILAIRKSEQSLKRYMPPFEKDRIVSEIFDS
ncbi:MAG: ABC transporter ATP-binding protein [Bacteroidota bacterium]